MSIRDAKEDLAALNAAVVGISSDTPATQKKFDETYGLGFTLLSDQHHETADSYGVWQEKKMYGKTSMGVVRSSFLIDEKGFIAEAWYKISPKDTVPLAKEALSR